MTRRRLMLIGIAALVCAPVPLTAQFELTHGTRRLRVGGQLQAQYSASSVPGANGGFMVPRARIIAEVDLDDFLGGRIQPDFAGGDVRLLDAYVRLEFGRELQVRLGQFKRAFDIFELAPVMDLSVIERDGRVEGLSSCTGVGGPRTFSRLTEALGFAGRDQGIRVEGARGRIGYMTTVTNGTGLGAPDENGTRSYSGRITLEATSGVQVSAQVALHDYQDAADRARYASAWSLDLEYGVWRDGAHVQAAVVGGDDWMVDGGAGDPARFLALQAVASWYRPTRTGRLSGVEPLVRVSLADPDTKVSADGAVLVTPGLMLYLGGRNKIGANLDVYAPRAGHAERSLRVQTYLSF